jgi:hypothetical protein
LPDALAPTDAATLSDIVCPAVLVACALVVLALLDAAPLILHANAVATFPIITVAV